MFEIYLARRLASCAFPIRGVFTKSDLQQWTTILFQNWREFHTHPFSSYDFFVFDPKSDLKKFPDHKYATSISHQYVNQMRS